MSYQHATFKIGDVTVDAIRSENGVYSLSLTSLANLCGKEHYQVIDFFQSKFWAKTNGKRYTPPKIRLGESNYSLVPLEYATAFIRYWYKRLDELEPLVSALMNESLTIRSERAFQPVDDYRLSQIQTATDEELKTKVRTEARLEHSGFQNACLLYKFSPSKAHDMLTKLVFGETAEEARLNEVEAKGYPWEMEKVGINHQRAKHGVKSFEIYRLTKKLFASYRKGTLEERLNRAYQTALTKI